MTRDAIRRAKRKAGLRRRRIRTLIERARYGVGEEDVFSFDTYVSGVLARGIKELRLTDSPPGSLTSEEWDQVLAEMQEGFEVWRSDAFKFGDPSNEAYRKVQKSLELLREHFGALWY